MCLCIPADTQFQEVYVKTTTNLCLAILALSLLTTPALAQRRGRSNMGGAMTGRTRADAVQDTKKKQDKDRDPAASTNKTHGKHKAKGHHH